MHCISVAWLHVVSLGLPCGQTSVSKVCITVQQYGVFKHRLTRDMLAQAVIQFRAGVAGEQGPQIVDLLKKNPGTAIPVVLSRLQQKDGEWRKVKQDMKPLFSKVFQQNYHKSLDHRSFYFKQTDKKTLGHKAMIQVGCTG